MPDGELPFEFKQRELGCLCAVDNAGQRVRFGHVHLMEHGVAIHERSSYNADAILSMSL